MRLAGVLLLLAAVGFGAAAPAQEPKWSEVVAKARGQTVNFNAWAGDENTNAFIMWVERKSAAATASKSTT